MNTDNLKCIFVVPSRRAAADTILEEVDQQAPLEVNVIFTTEKYARAALRAAGSLARNLRARLNLLVVKEVPLGFPLERPPVAIAFTQQRLCDLASLGVQGPLDTTVLLFYCRRRLAGLLQALKPNSLVVVGGSKRWWPTDESHLANILRAAGHQVIFPADK